MDTRRSFLKKASFIGGAAGINILPASIQQALAIDPAPGSTWKDAEHIVFLMQENRSFDHTYGTLQGVRGYNDPRAIQLPDDNPVWLQSDKEGNTYAPFRLNIKDTNATWMSSLPHSWSDQVDARNNGKYDKWLHFKPSWVDEYKGMPLTLGYYSREDIPFYYALADAFLFSNCHRLFTPYMLPCIGSTNDIFLMHRRRKNNINHIYIRVICNAVECLVIVDVLFRYIILLFPLFRLCRCSGHNSCEVTEFCLLERRCQQVGAVIPKPYQRHAKFIFFAVMKGK